LACPVPGVEIVEVSGGTIIVSYLGEDVVGGIVGGDVVSKGDVVALADDDGEGDHVGAILAVTVGVIEVYLHEIGLLADGNVSGGMVGDLCICEIEGSDCRGRGLD
jgi:hypothetical protein